jgi:hypothetical protein
MCLGGVKVGSGVEDDSGNIHFANVHLGVLDYAHRLSPQIRLIGYFRDNNYNAYGLQRPCLSKSSEE